MLFPVLLWSLSTILKVCGKNIPLDFSAKERTVNTVLNDVEQKKSNQWSQFPSKDLFENKLENLMQLDNLFHVKSKNIGSTFAPASYSSTSSATSTTTKHSPSSRASPSQRQQPSATTSATKTLRTSSSPRPSPTASKLSTSPSRKKLQLTTTEQKTTTQKTTKATRGAFNFRKREAASSKPSTTSKATTSSTTKPTTTVKPAEKITLNPKCLILKKLNAKLPPDCTSTSNIMDPWN
ncbi:spore coat protein SP96-like [Ruditapes philippinarum]|uniref:spore coat protein SP96-like n=1 Tax=Ruditapes philippinarum TaxID=129788 RepID=UPI00295A979F|nr:spore coat protein SP96-like [Ruditapes philippinarum]